MCIRFVKFLHIYKCIKHHSNHRLELIHGGGLKTSSCKSRDGGINSDSLREGVVPCPWLLYLLLLLAVVVVPHRRVVRVHSVAIRLIEIAIKQKGNRTTKTKTKRKITKKNLHTQEPRWTSQMAVRTQKRTGQAHQAGRTSKPRHCCWTIHSRLNWLDRLHARKGSGRAHGRHLHARNGSGRAHCQRLHARNGSAAPAREESSGGASPFRGGIAAREEPTGARACGSLGGFPKKAGRWEGLGAKSSHLSLHSLDQHRVDLIKSFQVSTGSLVCTLYVPLHYTTAG